MRLFTLDAEVADAAILRDVDAIREVLHAAAEAGGATVMAERFVEFPNGGLTGVLVLAQSHLSIHTWPELRFANVDLLSCGPLDVDAVLDVVARDLDVAGANRACLVRSPPRVTGPASPVGAPSSRARR